MKDNANAIADASKDVRSASTWKEEQAGLEIRDRGEVTHATKAEMLEHLEQPCRNRDAAHDESAGAPSDPSRAAGVLEQERTADGNKRGHSEPAPEG